jgi:hypothetical protein
MNPSSLSFLSLIRRLPSQASPVGIQCHLLPLAKPAKGSGRPIYEVAPLLISVHGLKRVNPKRKRRERVVTRLIHGDPRVEPTSSPSRRLLLPAAAALLDTSAFSSQRRRQQLSYRFPPSRRYSASQIGLPLAEATSGLPGWRPSSCLPVFLASCRHRLGHITSPQSRAPWKRRVNLSPPTS